MAPLALGLGRLLFAVGEKMVAARAVCCILYTPPIEDAGVGGSRRTTFVAALSPAPKPERHAAAFDGLAPRCSPSAAPLIPCQSSRLNRQSLRK